MRARWLLGRPEFERCGRRTRVTDRCTSAVAPNGLAEAVRTPGLSGSREFALRLALALLLRRYLETLIHQSPRSQRRARPARRAWPWTKARRTVSAGERPTSDSQSRRDKSPAQATMVPARSSEIRWEQCASWHRRVRWGGRAARAHLGRALRSEAIEVGVGAFASSARSVRCASSVFDAAWRRSKNGSADGAASSLASRASGRGGTRFPREKVATSSGSANIVLATRSRSASHGSPLRRSRTTLVSGGVRSSIVPNN